MEPEERLLCQGALPSPYDSDVEKQRGFGRLPAVALRQAALLALSDISKNVLMQ